MKKLFPVLIVLLFSAFNGCLCETDTSDKPGNIVLVSGSEADPVINPLIYWQNLGEQVLSDGKSAISISNNKVIDGVVYHVGNEIVTTETEQYIQLAYWKNTTKVVKRIEGSSAFGKDICVGAGKVHIAGVYVPKDAKNQSVFSWSEGGEPQLLTSSTFNAEIVGVYHDGANLYVAGYEANDSILVACYWVNGEKVNISDGVTAVGITGIYGSGTNVYITGIQGSTYSYWKLNDNTFTKTDFHSGTELAYMTDSTVVGSDIYICGYIFNNTIKKLLVGYWKNTVWTQVSDGSANAMSSSIFADGTEVYITGVQSNGTRDVGGYWKTDKTRVDVTNPTYNGNVSDIVYNSGNVHLIGYENNGLGAMSFYKRNSENKQYLSNGITNASLYSINMSGANVVITGTKNNFSKNQIVLWNNEKNKDFDKDILSDPEKYSTVYDMTTNGKDIYVAGSEGLRACYWKNNSPVYLTDGTYFAEAYKVVENNKDIHVLGQEYNQPVYWLNGVKSTLPGENSVIVGMESHEGSMYFIGYYVNNNKTIACYWKDGKKIDLADGTVNTFANDITFADGKVYVCGTETDDKNTFACYWENGKKKTIGTKEKNSTGLRIMVSDSKIIVYGYQQGALYNTGYWVDGKLKDFSVDLKNKFIVLDMFATSETYFRLVYFVEPYTNLKSIFFIENYLDQEENNTVSIDKNKVTTASSICAIPN